MIAVATNLAINAALNHKGMPELPPGDMHVRGKMMRTLFRLSPLLEQVRAAHGGWLGHAMGEGEWAVTLPAGRTPSVV